MHYKMAPNLWHYCNALAVNYQVVKTASRYDVPFRRYLGGSRVRVDSEHACAHVY